MGGLAALRAAGATSFGLALPRHGDPLGLGGPTAFNAAALEEGEAVVVGGAGLGLVPTTVGAATTWVVEAAAPRQLPDVGEADRALRAALIESAQALADLDVARWRPEVADLLMNLRHGPALLAPDGVPARCVELGAQGLQALDIVDVALEDQGGAVSAARDRPARGRPTTPRAGRAPGPGRRGLPRGLAAALRAAHPARPRSRRARAAVRRPPSRTWTPSGSRSRR